MCNFCSFGALLWFRESLGGQIQFWKSIGVRVKSLEALGWAFVVEWVWIFYSLIGLDELLYLNELYWVENWVWAWWILILVLFNVNGLVEFISIQPSSTVLSVKNFQFQQNKQIPNRSLSSQGVVWISDWAYVIEWVWFWDWACGSNVGLMCISNLGSKVEKIWLWVLVFRFGFNGWA